MHIEFSKFLIKRLIRVDSEDGLNGMLIYEVIAFEEYTR